MTPRMMWALVLAAIAVLALAALTVPGCVQQWRAQRAQSRVDAGQHGAAVESAKDAIGVQERAAARERASEDLTRQNEREIREAPGAGERVDAGVDLAGRRALCRRAAYANDPKCAVFKGEGR